jgi:hypothetical protein
MRRLSPSSPTLASSGEHAGYPLCLSVGCEGSGSRAVSQCSSEYPQVHSRGLESILLPLRVECVDKVLQVMVLRAVLPCQRLPSNVGHCLSTSRMRGGTSMLAGHLLPVEDLHCAGEIHACWPRNTIDLVL